MKRLLIISYSVITVGIIALMIFSILMSQNEKILNEKQEQRYYSYMLAAQLRQSSDDLTRMARTYVITRNTQYEKMYWDILAIRNGEKPRPKHYDRIYWDLVLSYGDKPRSDDETISLQELMKNAGFSTEEFAKLREAQNNSDGLVNTETIAMNAIKGLYDDGNGNYVKKAEPDSDMAIQIMHDLQYHKDKAAIMRPIDEFFVLLDKRTKVEVEYHLKKAEIFLVIIKALGLLLAVISVIMGFVVTIIISKQIGGEPAQIAQIAEQVANGELDMQFESTGKKATGIYATLQVMVKKLKTINHEREQQNWLKTGQAHLNEQISGEPEITALTANIISFLTTYVEAQVGLFYLLQEADDQPAYLQIIASYAYIDNNNRPKQFLVGEGLVGHAAAKRKTIVITQTPEECPPIIRSGLANAQPRYLLLLPFFYENILKGIIEIGSAKTLHKTQRDFLELVMPRVGIAINTAESRAEMQTLLEQSQQQAEKLQHQQGELQQSNEELQSQSEELQTQQEELRQTNEILEGRTRDLERQREAIKDKNQALETTQAEIEKAKAAIETKAQELELASKYKSEFLANMSHELRTPLNSILILAQMLAENKPGNLSDKQLEYAQTINNAGSDLLTLINEILDLSKVEAGRIDIHSEKVLLTELVETIAQKFRLLAQNKGLEFPITVADDMPTLHTDGQRLQQIITNLLSNAFKFTETGEISLIARYLLSNENISILNLEPSKTIAISVTDTGIGIPQDKQQVIFEAFQQADGSTSRSYGGTGLGLSISRQLARLLGGELTLASEEGKGSTFTLYLPIGKPIPKSIESGEKNLLSQTAPAQTVPETATINAQLGDKAIADDRNNLQSGDKSILIVEDDRKFASIIMEQARDRNFKCLVAEDGKTGLKLVDEYQPQAIILDVELPQLDGFSVMEKLKDNPTTRHIPVHFISASEQDVDAKRMGAIGYLHKPVNVEELSKALKKIEQFLAKTVKTVLIVTDNEQHQQQIISLVGEKNVQTTLTTTIAIALQHLKAAAYDCIILDMDVEQSNGVKLCEQLYNEDSLSQIPIILYAERELAPQEEQLLQRCSNNLTIKAVKSPERLLDEATLFLHQVENNLPTDKRKMLHRVHDKETILKQKKVLIVDDDIRNSFALMSFLEGKDMKVVLADNGKKALALLEKHPDTAIVLMDVMMPEMDGYEAIQEIRKQFHFRQIPIIALTAKAMKGDKAKCIEAGANDYLAKPVDTDKLISLMRVWLYR